MDEIPDLAIAQIEPNVRIYHSRVPLSRFVEEVYYRNGSQIEDNELATMMLQTPGVVKLTFHAYQLTVHRAPLFSWEEIDDHPKFGIMRLLRNYIATMVHMDMADVDEKRIAGSRSNVRTPPTEPPGAEVHK